MRWTLVSAVALIAVLSGCGTTAVSTKATAVTTSQAQLCQDLQGLHTSLTQLSNVSGQTTVGQYQQAKNSVTQQWNQVKQAAQDVANAKTNLLNAAGSNLQTAINQLPQDETLAQALPTVQTQVTDLQNAYSQTYVNLNCQAYVTPTATQPTQPQPTPTQ